MSDSPEAVGATVQGAIWTFWTLAAFAAGVTAMNFPLPKSFKDAVLVAAARGKTWETRPPALGPLRDWSVKHAWFWHFYAIGLLCTSLVNAASNLCLSAQATPVLSLSSMLCLLLLEVHMFRRLIESTIILRYPKEARMHAFAYFFGLAYYIVLPLSLVDTTCLRFLVGASIGSVKARGSSVLPSDGYYRTELWESGHAQLEFRALLDRAPRWMLYGFLFTLGSQLLQSWLHCKLAFLGSANRPGSMVDGQKYALPRGGFFELLLAPHYFAEILIYVGLATVAGGGYIHLLILTWVVSNLVVGARATKDWYMKVDPDYAARRFALVPFVF